MLYQFDIVETNRTFAITHGNIANCRCSARCTTDVERALKARPDVQEARVTLTLRRVAVQADPGTDPAALPRSAHPRHAQLHGRR